MFKCETCEYGSNKKFNMQKHITNVHKREATEGEMKRVEITNQEEQKTIKEEQKTTQNKKNNSTQNFVCEKCKKFFKSKKGYKKHIPICKGVCNKLECHHCHKVLSSQQSKSKHMKYCKVKKIEERTRTLNQTEYHNTNNINNVNNQQIINHYHYNYNYRISKNELYGKYNIEEENIEEENIEGIYYYGNETNAYIPVETMDELAKNYDVKGYMNIVYFNMEHPENHNIRLNDNKSVKVLRNGRFEVETKQIIYLDMYKKSKTVLLQHTNNKKLSSEQLADYMILVEHSDKKNNKINFNFIDVKITEVNKQKYLKHKYQKLIPMKNNEVITLE